MRSSALKCLNTDFSGFEICPMIKASFFFETPVVLVGRSGDEDRDSPCAFHAGADDYFVSFTDWQLVLAKFEWLAQRRFALSLDGEKAGTVARPKPDASYLHIVR